MLLLGVCLLAQLHMVAILMATLKCLANLHCRTVHSNHASGERLAERQVTPSMGNN